MTSDRHVVLVGNFLPDRQESMQRFAQMLSDGMTARGWRVDVWRPTPHFASLARQYRYGGWPKYLGYLDKFIVFPNWIRRQRRRMAAEPVYHIVDQGNAVYENAFTGARLLLTCHDLLQIRSALGEFPQHHVSRTGRRYQQWILKHLRALRRVICISGKTRADLQRLINLPVEAMPIIYMGQNYPYRPVPRAEALEVLQPCVERQSTAWPRLAQSPHGFFLGVGGGHWYKNRTGLISIFSELQKSPGMPNQLVYVGPQLDAEQNEILARHGLADAVVRLSGVSNEQLRAAYAAAEGLIFPSWEEGFGWPIAEAQACGCPVFTSNREPMTEVGGDAACYIDPADPVGAAARIAAALPNRATMREAGLRQAARWDTVRMLDGYEAEYLGGTQENPALAALGS